MNYEYISIDTIEENKKLLGEVEKLRNEKQELLETIDMITNDASEYVKRIDKAIEYITHEWFKREQIGISHLSFSYDELQHILDILRGEYNE